MFDNLSDKLNAVFKKLKGHGKLTEKNIEEGLREVRLALLEADVHYRVAKKFIADIKGGADAMKLEHAEVVEADGKKTFRYMKPIMTAGQPCLACHGSELKLEVSAKIKELYPNDQATGFSAGDMRGAFTVSKVME